MPHAESRCTDGCGRWQRAWKRGKERVRRRFEEAFEDLVILALEQEG